MDSKGLLIKETVWRSSIKDKTLISVIELLERSNSVTLVIAEKPEISVKAQEFRISVRSVVKDPIASIALEEMVQPDRSKYCRLLTCASTEKSKPDTLWIVRQLRPVK